MDLTFQEILNMKTDNFFQNKKVKLVRHKDSRKEYRELIKDREELLKYQEEQDTHKFKDCEYIISFIGQEQKKALLFGIFKVNGYKELHGKYYYDLELLSDYNFLYNRIIISWDNPRIWAQWYDKPKEVIQILPQGYLGSFPGLLNFVLNYDELERLFKYPEANQDWKNHLSSVDGIYMILNLRTGNQYIGSANGKEGIWQRWSEYAKNYTGGNTMLKEILAENNSDYKNFRYSILQTLPSNITQNEIVKIENLYKEKLGSRFHGLNESERVHKVNSIGK